jgi:DNA-binding IclR family transcriptional regulator
MDVERELPEKTPESSLAQTVLKALDTLECLARADEPVTAHQVAREIGLSRTTAYRLLSTLATRGYVTGDKDGRYQLGLGLLRLSQTLLERLELPALAKPILRETCRLSNETVFLGIRDGTEALYIDKVESPQPVRLCSIAGTRNPLHTTSLGKAILAFLSDEERITLLESVNFMRRASNSITDRAALVEQLGVIRGRGYAIDDIENEDGVRCIGAPIFDHARCVVAGISIAGPAYRLSVDRLTQLAPVVMHAANAISTELGGR